MDSSPLNTLAKLGLFLDLICNSYTPLKNVALFLVERDICAWFYIKTKAESDLDQRPG